MSEQIITILENLFGNAYALIVFIGSAIPITEQRATIPLGIYWNLPPLQVMLLALIGSYLPVPFLLLFFEKHELAAHFPELSRLTVSSTRKYKKMCTDLKNQVNWADHLVAIPLPGTGLWTGSLLLHFLFQSEKITGLHHARRIISAVALTLLSVFCQKRHCPVLALADCPEPVVNTLFKNDIVDIAVINKVRPIRVSGKILLESDHGLVSQ